ncbi:MAG: GTP-binding protein, partial [Sedimentisphaerales bacterium]|nr:GTP-binding protein [Sedimentisphaerales bacterium]
METKTTQNKKLYSREQMNIVVIGHVDHGKSTVVGKLLADTGSLPNGKLEEVKRKCAANSKPFEYAFLLDALKDEQAQGITIDSARCFFRSAKREYIIIDAPGHIEFLKNMISGAARAEAAFLVIDAKEGIAENSRRHGYLLSMLGIRQVAVLVNKMDLIEYSQDVFEQIQREYANFLGNIGIEASGFIPVSARHGDNIVFASENMAWYRGYTVVGMADGFENARELADKSLRFPVQDIYKFTEDGDERRIFAGRIETGSVYVGDDVVFLPSQKTSRIASIEGFNSPVRTAAYAGESTGFTLERQVYIQPGELMCKIGQQFAQTGQQFRANIFWMGKAPMIKGKRYKLKLAGVRAPVWLKEIHTVLDAVELTTDSSRGQVEWHDVAECTFETLKPIGFDLAADIAQTGRFVIIDNYEIAGGGIVLAGVDNSTSRIEEHVRNREQSWERTAITAAMRSGRYGQRATLVLITGDQKTGKVQLAKKLEESFFERGRLVYYLGLSNSLLGIGSDAQSGNERDEYLRRLGEMSHLFTDAGVILITTVSSLDDYELKMIKTL